MPNSSLDGLLERFSTDPEFRAQVRRDPDAAAAAAGVTLSDDEKSALKAVDWSESDEQLLARASKMKMGGACI